MNWDEFFMTMAYLAAMKCKDKRTHIGAVVVGKRKEVRSLGYNGLPRGADDDVPERQEAPEKYYWFEHAERNAIYNATLMGVSLEGCTMYTNGTPCMGCARAVVQSGIKEVVVDKAWDEKNEDIWKEEAERSVVLFKETGVTLRKIEYELIQIKRFRRCKEIDK